MAELSHRKRVPGARLVWLFRVTLVQRTLVSAGRQVPGRSVRWGDLRRPRPFSDRYGYDRGTPIEHYYIDRDNRDADLHADLNVPGSLPVGSFDYVILTQVLQFLSPETALANVWASLAPGGVLMLTVPSLARVDPHDPGTDFWRFTPNGLAELLHRLGMPASVAGYGNVLACVASLWGPSVEEISATELDVADPRFPLVACAHAEKAR